MLGVVVGLAVTFLGSGLASFLTAELPLPPSLALISGLILYIVLTAELLGLFFLNVATLTPSSAAKELLDRTGLIKTEKVQVEASNGVMLMPPKNKERD